jgi:glyoxylase-like metal-dependent hydrolase (beta-lactamase superfamily II)
VALTLGDLEIETLVATRFALDGGAMFGVVPKTLWSRESTSDADNRIPLVARVMLVTNRRAGYRALVDVGLGDAWSDREKAAYALDGVPLERALEDNGVAPESITDVVLTHLHWDHAGGLATRDESGRIRRALPNARLHVGAEHRAYALRVAAKDKGSFRADEIQWAHDPATHALDDGEVLPGLFVSRSHGHTPGLLVVEARSDEGRVIYPADLLPMRAHVRPAWGMAYDNFPLTVVEEKRALVEAAARDGAVIVLEHDPSVSAVRVRVEGGRWVAEPVAGIDR